MTDDHDLGQRLQTTAAGTRLTDAEIEALRASKKRLIAYGRERFADLVPKTKVE